MNKINTNTISEDTLTFYKGYDEIQCKERQKKKKKEKKTNLLEPNLFTDALTIVKRTT
jgi:hypothetical protein